MDATDIVEAGIRARTLTPVTFDKELCHNCGAFLFSQFRKEKTSGCYLRLVR